MAPYRPLHAVALILVHGAAFRTSPAFRARSAPAWGSARCGIVTNGIRHQSSGPRGPVTQDLSRRSRRRKRGAFYEKVRGASFVSREPAPPANRKKPFRYLCVLDVEATCDEHKRNYVHEIIELPVVLVDLEAPSVEAEFHTFVRPTVNTTLTKFCTRLTGIKQEQVDQAPTLDVVLGQLDGWLREQPGLYDEDGRRNFAFTADGPWDLRVFIDGECSRKGIPKAEYFAKWVNLKKLFSDFYKCRPCKIHKMLEMQGLRFEGRLHSGIDDSRNIARIAMKMAQDGCIMYLNEGLPRQHKFAPL